jgi:hypothetical protein
MAEPRNPGPDPMATDIPTGLLEALSRPAAEPIRAFEVARGRRRAFERAYDDGDVVDEIASRLLVLSTPA